MSGRTEDAATAPSPELVLAQLDDLPTPGPLVLRLLDATAGAASSARDVAELLRADQSLTARLLSLANSAAFGARSEISSIEQAIVRLGFKTVRSVVLATRVFACFARDGAPAGKRFDLTEFWKHSLAVACGARRIVEAGKLPGVDAELAFVAGLLHDLGKAALRCVYPRAYERAACLAEETRGDIADAERAVLGTDHTVAGRRMAERWGLPRDLQNVIWLHHLAGEALPASLRTQPLIGLIRLADTLAREQRIGYSGNHIMLEPASMIAPSLGIAPPALEAATGLLAGDVAYHVGLLGLGRDTPEALYVRSLSAANAELGRLNTELAAGQRRAAAGARYFRALSHFDRRLEARLELSRVADALLEATNIALPSARSAAFALPEPASSAEVAWRGGSPRAQGTATERVEADLREWLRGAGGLLEARPQRLPSPVRALLASGLHQLGEGEFWLLPIVQGSALVGGVIYPSAQEEAAALLEEGDELRAFLASLGLAIGRANAHAAATRLTEDLAQTNRRLQHAQSEVLRNRTLSMIAEMAAGAGHELNGPLTVISGRAQMLRSGVSDPELQRSLDLIHSKAHECSRIVSELMDFARPRPPRFERVELLALLAEVRQTCVERLELPASRLVLAAGAPAGAAIHLQADAAQLRTVIYELVRNAVDATRERGSSITLEWRAAPSGGLAGGEADGARRAVQLTVRDAGAGMSAAVLQRAFDPFYSHRKAGRGRGLGLARAFRIVEAHGGRIWLESQVDEGTQAHVVLPVEG